MADLEGEQGRHLVRAFLAVEGMHCTACSSTVEAALKRLPGVVDAQVSSLNQSGEVTFDRRQAAAADLLQAVEESGFKATLRSEEPLQPSTQLARLRIEGMTCSSCSSAVETALAETVGVRHAVVSLTLQEAKVEFDPEEVEEVRIHMHYHAISTLPLTGPVDCVLTTALQPGANRQ